ncbi:cobalamin B12-binding domain-containing protein [Nannocystis bainbridge]|uniref:Cobalamin-dependent protein n=1 Tax=Nannocystis bainbridge TaxID=2995303 RepID=A0ABT5DRV7_9BACT|nr:cobalamin-dependent protein [Nannocystis bainbridge]MDC0716329.1 cobalamin-dependent protein [Nannocystis bainbridge]
MTLETTQGDRFAQALLAGDHPAANACAREAFTRGVDYLYEDVVKPALARIGEMWARNQITIAEQHVATALAQSVLGALYPEFPWPPPGPPAIIACVAGELHELGARMVADLLTLDGWDGMFLGADVSDAALLERVAQTRPALVVLSVTMVPGRRGLAPLVASLQRLTPAPKLLVGGAGMLGKEDLDLPPGAGAVLSSARAAVEWARRWKP